MCLNCFEIEKKPRCRHKSILKRFSAANLAMFYSFCLRDFFHKLLFAIYIVAKMTFTSVCVSGRGENLEKQPKIRVLATAFPGLGNVPLLRCP